MATKILLIENDTAYQKNLQTELEDGGYQVVLAEDGNDAVEKLLTEAFDLILYDLDISGVEYLEKLVETKRDARIVILATPTACCLDFRSWIADALVDKSAQLDEIISNIQKISSIAGGSDYVWKEHPSVQAVWLRGEN